MAASNHHWWLRISRSWLMSCLIYAGLVIGLQWPLVRQPTTGLPMGPTNSAVVPLFNLWTYWWNADRATQWFRGYWDAPIFFPVADTFAFSEPQPTALIVAPVIWITGSRILAYNIYFWLAWLLNGVFTEKLLRQRGSPIVLARLGGLMMIMLPLLQWNRDVIQLVPVWGILWIWSCLLKLSQAPKIPYGIELGLAAGMTSLMCMHYGLFTAILTLAAGGVLLKGWARGKTWASWATGGLVAAIIAGPMIWKVHSTLQEITSQRPEALVQNLSLRPGDYTAAWGRPLIPWGDLAARVNWQSSPGWLKCLAAVIGLGWGIWDRRSRRWVLFLGLTAGAALAMSLGKNLTIRNWSVWDQLCRIVPGLGHVRSPYRFANYFQLAIALLAMEALRIAWIRDRARRIRLAIWAPVTFREKMGRSLGRWLIGGAALAMMLEVLPFPMEVWNISQNRLGMPWVEYVRRETPPGRGILCLPFASGYQLDDFGLTAKWMYQGTFHGVPLVNGYSGFFPVEETDLRGELQDHALTIDRLIQLQEEGVEFVVMSMPHSPRPLPAATETLAIEKVFSDPSGVEVYRLSRRK
jgi:hypothetical protein